MKTIITTLAFVLTGALCTASTQAGQVVQTARPPVPQKMTPPEVVLTGCLLQGTSDSVFILDNAKKDPNSALEKGARYLLNSVVEDVDLRTHLKHTVRVTGEVDMKVSAMPIREKAGSDPRLAEERTLPRLNAKSLTMVSNTCAPAR